MSPERKTKTCPYLGLIADPDTISAEADPINHCYVHKPPQQVEVEYQRNYCLSGNFTRCEIYTQFVNQNLVNAGIVTEAEIESASEPVQEFEEVVDVEDTEPEEITAVERVSKQEERTLPNRRDDEWREKLRQEAQNQYDNVSDTKQRKGLWTLLFIVAIAILAASVWGILRNINPSQASAQENNGNGSSEGSLATSMSEMGRTAGVLATAASAFEGGRAVQEANTAATSTAAIFQAQQALEATMAASGAAVGLCTSVDEAEFVIVQGPLLEPSPGYQYVEGSETIDVESSWVIENIGSCIWENVYMLSVNQGSIVTPTLRIDGEIVSFANPDGKVNIQPDERIELVLPFDLEQAEDVNEEYVLIVNGLTLFDQPQLVLEVEGWVKIVRSGSTFPLRSTPTPTSKPAEKPPTDAGPPRPTVTQQPPDREP